MSGEYTSIKAIEHARSVTARAVRLRAERKAKAWRNDTGEGN